jgi:hypothetical protein
MRGAEVILGRNSGQVLDHLTAVHWKYEIDPAMLAS